MATASSLNIQQTTESKTEEQIDTSPIWITERDLLRQLRVDGNDIRIFLWISILIALNLLWGLGICTLKLTWFLIKEVVFWISLKIFKGFRRSFYWNNTVHLDSASVSVINYNGDTNTTNSRPLAMSIRKITPIAEMAGDRVALLPESQAGPKYFSKAFKSYRIKKGKLANSKTKKKRSVCQELKDLSQSVKDYETDCESDDGIQENTNGTTEIQGNNNETTEIQKNAKEITVIPENTNEITEILENANETIAIQENTNETIAIQENTNETTAIQHFIPQPKIGKKLELPWRQPFMQLDYPMCMIQSLPSYCNGSKIRRELGAKVNWVRPSLKLRFSYWVNLDIPNKLSKFSTGTVAIPVVKNSYRAMAVKSGSIFGVKDEMAGLSNNLDTYLFHCLCLSDAALSPVDVVRLIGRPVEEKPDWNCLSMIIGIK